MAFLFVYIREAHPDDEWQMESNVKTGVVFEQPKTMGARSNVAQKCCSTLKLTMPCLVDDMNNSVDEAYAGWPERLFVVGEDNKVKYAATVGPFGFDPGAVETWLHENVGQPSKGSGGGS